MACLYQHFDGLPLTKQSILVYITKLELLTSVLMILLDVFTTWTMVSFRLESYGCRVNSIPVYKKVNYFLLEEGGGGSIIKLKKLNSFGMLSKN